MTWSAEALLAIARRLARLVGAHGAEAFPIVRLRDRQLLGIYVRGIGFVRW